jgi:KDO2-lipid IV(A) lauroyltransferase
MRALYRLVPLLPREALVALGRAAGRWGFTLLRQERKVALANLDLAYGDALSPRAKRRIARQAFESFGQVGLEIFWSRRLDERMLARIVEIDEADLQRVRDIMAAGRGLVAVASHFGSWEVMNLHASACGFPTTTLTRRLRNEPLNALVNANRRHTGSEILYHDEAARGILRALKRKRAIAIPLDQNTRPDRGGVYVSFFGKPVAASRAVAVFALRTGAPIVPAVCFPLRGGRYRIAWYAPVEIPPDTGDADARERLLTQRCLDTIERAVRSQPGAWLWMYRRWKYRPTADATGFPWYSKHLPEPSTTPEGAKTA